jgi:hypothetical protein
MKEELTLPFKLFVDCSPEERRERWSQARRVLNGLDVHERDQHWDMSIFGAQTVCGTIACAAGHCGRDPWFIERGFQLLINSGAYAHFSGRDPGEAVERFFGWRGSNVIFFNPTKRSVDRVIAEIDHFLKTDEFLSDGDIDLFQDDHDEDATAWKDWWEGLP